LATWNLSSSSEPPQWWSDELHECCVRLADRAYPNEACGLFVLHPDTGRVELHELSATATPRSFFAEPAAVVRFAYEALANGWRVVGTFHTHPNGSSVLSERDELLRDWADQHVLAHRSGATWKFQFWIDSAK
jgi:proteasome lid subunit RPN8/RPN11